MAKEGLKTCICLCSSTTVFVICRMFLVKKSVPSLVLSI